MKLSELIEAEINQVLGGYLGPDDAAAAITARLHECVKPLEWEGVTYWTTDDDGGPMEGIKHRLLSWKAGGYRIIRQKGPDGIFILKGASEDFAGLVFPYFKAAKAQAQAHYAAQIIAGLDL